MTDLASLQLRVESLEVDTAKRRLNDLTGSAGKAERASDGLTGGFKRLVGPLVAAVSAMEGLNKLVEVQRNFDKLNAGLITATGSSENAAVAFEALQQFAQRTPYSLDQAVEGFTKLVNLGLTPSERALTSYGNTAAAMGKDLNQMIEAVADAATGEFERLKEFGIKASQQGDKVTFTFQGMTKTVANNAAEIEKYLMSLGENEFASAMELRAKTLDGAIAQLGDTWDKTFLLVSKGGIGEAIAAGVNLASDALTELNAMLESGEMAGYLEAAGIAFSDWGDDAVRAAHIVGEALQGLYDDMEVDGPGAVKFLSDAFSQFPENVRAFIQLMVVEVASGLDRAEAYAVSFKDRAKAIFTDDTQDAVTKRLEADLVRINGVRDDSIASILSERDATVAASAAATEAARKRREEWDAEQKRKAADKSDRLARFKAEGDGSKSVSELKAAEKAAEAAKKKSDAEAKRQAEEFKKLQESLQTETEAVQASYDKRRAIIEKNTAEGSAARDALMAKLDKAHQKELDQLNGIEEAYAKKQRLFKEYTKIQEDGWDDSAKAAQAYQDKMETLWQSRAAGVISEQEHEKAVADVTKEYEKQGQKASDTMFSIDELGKQAARNMQDAFADFLFDPFADGLDGMLTGFLKVVQRMLAEAAAAQIAQKLIGTGGGSGGWGWLGTIAQAGMALYTGGASSAATASASMAAGASQAGYAGDLSTFVPGRAVGGPTVGGQLYEVGERGPETFEQNGRRFLISGRGGNVSPLGDEVGGAGNVINITVSTVVNSDGSSTSDTNGNNSDRQARQLTDQIKAVTLGVINDEMRDGGLLSRTTGG